MIWHDDDRSSWLTYNENVYKKSMSTFKTGSYQLFYSDSHVNSLKAHPVLQYASNTVDGKPQKAYWFGYLHGMQMTEKTLHRSRTMTIIEVMYNSH